MRQYLPSGATRMCDGQSDLVLAVQCLVDGVRNGGAGEDAPPDLGLDASKPLMLEANPFAEGVDAALIRHPQRRYFLDVLAKLDVLDLEPVRWRATVAQDRGRCRLVRRA